MVREIRTADLVGTDFLDRDADGWSYNDDPPTSSVKARRQRATRSVATIPILPVKPFSAGIDITEDQ